MEEAKRLVRPDPLDPVTEAFTDGGWLTYGLQEVFGVGVIECSPRERG